MQVVWVGGLLVLAIAVSAGLLLARYRLEAVRDNVVEAVSRQVGAAVAVDSAMFVSPTSIRLRQLRFETTSNTGVNAAVTAPSATVSFELAHLLQGDLRVGALHLEQALLEVSTPSPGSFQLDTGGHDDAGSTFHLLALPPGLTVTGTRATIRVVGPAEFPLVLRDVRFSAADNALGGGATAELEGTLHIAGGEVPVAIDIEESRGLLEAEVRATGLSIEQIQRVGALDARAPLRSGALDPVLRLEGNGSDWRIDWTADVRDVELANAPDFLNGLNGHVRMTAELDATDQILRIRDASADFGNVSGDLSGIVDLAASPPLLNVRLESGRLPVEGLLDEIASLAEERTKKRTSVHAELTGPSQLLINLSGPLTQPDMVVRANAGSGFLSLESQDETLPDADLHFGLLEAVWDSATRKPSATFTVVGGEVSHIATALQADEVSGSLRLEHPLLTFDPLTAAIRGNRFVGSAEFDFEQRQGAVELRGKLSQLERTPLADAIRDTELSGAADVELTATVADGGVRFAGEVDATDTEIVHRTWFWKPYGLSVRAAFEGSVRQEGGLELVADLTAAGTDARARLDFAPGEGRLDLRRCVMSIDSLDAVTAGRALRIPYRVSEGVVRAGEYEWTRDPGERADGTRYWHSEGWAELDALTIQAEGAEFPIRGRGLRVDFALRNGVERTGQVRVRAESAVMPPFGTRWFGAPDVPQALRQRYPPRPRDFSFVLEADSVEAPPWVGTAFYGDAFLTEEATGLRSYRATIDGGSLEGSFRKDRIENASENAVSWDGVPILYLTKHLNQPEILDGPSSGEVTYSRDSDDPRSLRGSGTFEVVDGQFSADYLLYEMGLLASGDAASLPPSLRFSRLYSEVQFEQDVIRTPTVVLESEGVRVEAAGTYTVGGDLSYDVDLRLAPEVAREIPALQEHLNLEGHTLAQQDIHLAFELSGSAERPRSAVSQATPVSVTLVAGGLEVVSEAAKVIDIPRKVLGDLLKIGGGLVGVTRSTE